MNASKTLCLFLLFLFPCSLFSQTNVDRLVRALDSLTLASYNDWKVSPDLKSYSPQGDPTQAGFDDSKWNNLRLNQSIYPDSVWIRKVIVVPEKILGKPVSGPLRLVVAVDDYGYMYINGANKGFFPWDGDFVLTDNAKPGDRFVVAIRAINTGGPLRLISAKIESEEAKALRILRNGFELLADFVDGGLEFFHRPVGQGIEVELRCERLKQIVQSLLLRFVHC